MQSYAKTSWFHHIQNIDRLKTSKGNSDNIELTSNVVKAIEMLDQFMEEEDTAQEWSRDLRWDFFDESECATIMEFIGGIRNVEQSPYLSSTFHGSPNVKRSREPCSFHSQKCMLEKFFTATGFLVPRSWL